MLNGSLSDEVRKKLYEQFVSGSLACNELTGFPELEGLVLDYQNLDPVNMVTGAYNFMYEDLKLEGVIPLTFLFTTRATTRVRWVLALRTVTIIRSSTTEVLSA